MSSKIKIVFIKGFITPLGRERYPRQDVVWEKLSKLFDIDIISYNLYVSLELKKAYIKYGFLLFLKVFSRLLKERPHILVTPSLPFLESIIALLIMKLLRRPIILKETHWYWPKTLTSRVLWPINLFLLKKADLILTPGIRSKKYLESILNAQKSKIMIVPFYTSLLRITPEALRLSRNLREKLRNKVVILFFGRLIERKGVDYLIKAFAKLRNDFKDVILVIAGDGDKKKELISLCKKLEIMDSVLFTGFIPQKLKTVYFLLADIYVYPSISTEIPEEWSLGVVEAMSVGKPVIVTTAVGSAPDVVINGVNGYIIPEKSVEALYIKLKKLVSSENLRNYMGLNSRRVIRKKFQYSHLIRGYVNAINLVLKSCYNSTTDV